MIRLLCLLLSLFSPVATAGGIAAYVTDLADRPIEDVVVIFEALGGDHAGTPKALASTQRAVIDQRNLRFVPEISVIRSGTAVEFPNSDNVRHQVYSFSPAKSFKLALYAGRVYPPLLFEKAGLVTLGCNIHDSMIGFVYITDSPWFGKTNAQGRLAVTALPPGEYRATLWHPRFPEHEPQLERPVTVNSQGDAVLTVRLAQPMQPTPNNNTATRWKGY